MDLSIYRTQIHYLLLEHAGMLTLCWHKMSAYYAYYYAGIFHPGLANYLQYISLDYCIVHNASNIGRYLASINVSIIHKTKTLQLELLNFSKSVVAIDFNSICCGNTGHLL